MAINPWWKPDEAAEWRNRLEFRRPRAVLDFMENATGAGGEGPLLAHLDGNHLRAAVREALAHGALLDRTLQMKGRFRRGAGRLVAIARFAHAHS